MSSADLRIRRGHCDFQKTKRLHVKASWIRHFQLRGSQPTSHTICSSDSSQNESRNVAVSERTASLRVLACETLKRTHVKVLLLRSYRSTGHRSPHSYSLKVSARELINDSLFFLLFYVHPHLRVARRCLSTHPLFCFILWQFFLVWVCISSDPSVYAHSQITL